MKIKNKRIKKDLDKYVYSIVNKFDIWPFRVAENLVKRNESKKIVTLLMMTIPKDKRQQYIKAGKWKLNEIPVVDDNYIVLIFFNEKQKKELVVEICKYKHRWKYIICQYDFKSYSNIEFKSVFRALESPLSDLNKYKKYYAD